MAIELASAYVQIIPSLKGAQKSIAKELGGVEDEFKKAGDGAGSKFSDGLKKAVQVIGAASVAAVSATAAEIGIIIKQSVNQYADFEQQVGGIETMFKTSSGTMLKYAQEAYKTAGVSANDYMRQATAFSAALLQSLKGNTEKATKYANMAMVDMSDNANKFGTVIEDIQHAYQGFAKQNYTMLDNLKLGYGGTKKEMERLLKDAQKMPEALGKKFNLSNYSDVVEAIHVVQQHMGVAGTTIAEATTTISGSFGMLTASWSNLLANLGATSDMGAISVKQMAANVTESAGYYIDNVGAAVARIVEKTPSLGKELFANFRNDIAPKLKDAGIEVFQSFIKGMESTFPNGTATIKTHVANVIATFKPLVTSVATLGRSIGEGLAPGVTAITSRLGGEGTGAVKLFTTAITAATPTVTAIANAVGALAALAAKIPTPVLAVTATMVGLHAAGNKIPGILRDITSGLEKGTKSFLAHNGATSAAAKAVKSLSKTWEDTKTELYGVGYEAHTSAGKAAEAIDKMSISSVVAKGAIETLKVTMKTALVSTGIGLAIAAVTAAIGYFINKIGEAKRAQKEFDQSVQDLAKTMRDAGGEMSRQQWADVWATQLKKAKEAGHDASAAAEKLGLSWARVLDVFESGNIDKQSEMIEMLRGRLGPLSEEYEKLRRGAVWGDTITLEQSQVIATLGAEKKAIEDLLGPMEEMVRQEEAARAVYEATTTSAQKYADSLNKLKNALNEAKDAQDRFNDAPVETARAHVQAMDAGDRFAESVKNWEKAVKKYGENSQEAIKAFYQMEDAGDVAASAAQNLGNAIYFETQNAYLAEKGTEQYIQRIIELGKEGKLTQDEVARLTAKARDWSKGAADAEANSEKLKAAQQAMGTAFEEAMKRAAENAHQIAANTRETSRSSDANSVYRQTILDAAGAQFKMFQQQGQNIGSLTELANKTGISRTEFEQLAVKAGYSVDEIKRVSGAVNAVPNKHISFTHNANGVKAEIVNAFANPVTQYVNIVATGNVPDTKGYNYVPNKADGGIVQAFANGGFNTVARVPQIVKGGANILWGEPETGWEAYISGKPSMRLRNIEILEEVARRFGQQLIPLATGGVLGSDSSYSGRSARMESGAKVPMNLHITNIHPQAEPTSKTIDRALQRGAVLGLI